MLSLPPHQMLFLRLLADLNMLESHTEAFAVQIAQCEGVAALAGQNHPFVVLPHMNYLGGAVYGAEPYIFVCRLGGSEKGAEVCVRSQQVTGLLGLRHIAFCITGATCSG